MAAFNKSRSSGVVIALSFLFLTLTFAHDHPSPSAAPTAAETTDGPAVSPSPRGASESDIALTPASVSYIASSPDEYSAAAPGPSEPPSTMSYSSSSSDETGELPDTSVTSPIDVPGVPKDIQAQVTKVVQSSVISVKFQTEEFMKNVIAKRLSDPETEEETRECLKQCRENYGEASEDVTKVVEDLNTGDYYKAMVDVEGISTFVDTCNDCMKEMVGDDPEFKQFDDWIKGVTGDCLDQLDKLNS